MTPEDLVNDVKRALSSDTRIDQSMVRVSGEQPGVIVLDGQVDTTMKKCWPRTSPVG